MPHWPDQPLEQQSAARNRLNLLREKAEAALATGYAAETALSPRSVDQILRELRSYQSELEDHNDELVSFAENRLDAHQFYQGLFASLPLPAFVINGGGVISEANRAAQQLSSNSRSLDGTSIYRLLDHNSGSRLDSICNTISATNGSGHDAANQAVLDIHLSPVLGAGYNHFKAYLSYFSGDMGLRDHFLLVLRDVTHEEKLNRKRALFAAVIDSCDEPVFALNQYGVVVASNHKAQQFLGLDPSVASTLIFDCPLPENAREVLRGALSQVRRGLPLGHHQSVWDMAGDTHPDSHRRGDNFHARIFQITGDDTHDFVGVILTQESEKVRSLRELDITHRLFKQTDQGIMIVGPDARISFVNSAFERITGYKSDEVCGQDPRILSSGRQTKSFYRRFWQALNSEGYWEGEIWNKRKSGEVFPEWLTVSKLQLSNGTSQFLATFSDISNIKEKEDQILNLAFYDQLTGLGNRHRFDDSLARMTSGEERQQNFCLMFIDLDGFKAVNDLYGHEAGDFVLQRVSSRLSNIKRQGDSLFRLGGDEFVYIFKGLEVEQRASKAQQIVEHLCRPYHIKDQDMIIAASVGVASYPEDGTDVATLLRHADAAMYQAKTGGGDRFEFFDPGLQQRFDRSVSVREGLKRAIDANEINCVFQPIIDLTSGGQYGTEALMRWHAAGLGDVHPAEFIPEAESSGHIKQLSSWMVQQAMDQMAVLPTADRQNLGRIFINLSGHDFRDIGQFDHLTQMLSKQPELAAQLAIDITEDVLMDNPALRGKQLQQLRALGLQIAIDDFGTGYSSLAELVNFEVDILKIDASFIHGIGADQQAEMICQSIISMSQNIGVLSLAEGVETQAQLDFLKAAGCQLAQGFVVAHPGPLTIP